MSVLYPSFPEGTWGDLTNDVWSIASLSSGIASGGHVMEFNTPIYDAYGWDGWLLYDGDITSAGSPTTNPITYGYEYTVYWMDPSTIQPNSWPTISAPSVTPTFAVTGIGNGGVNYWIDSDGIVSTYVPGTAITQPGKYRVWAEAWGSTAAALTEAAVPQQRILAGADFTCPTIIALSLRWR